MENSSSDSLFKFKVCMWFGLVGFVIPAIVLIVDWVTDGWYPDWVTFVWPTWLLLIPYGGDSMSFEKLMVAILSATGNGVIYSVIGLILSTFATKVKLRNK